MATPERYVIDTNVLISFLLFYGSVPGQAVTKAWSAGVLLRSDNTLSELARVLERPKFDRYLTRYERAIFLQRFIQDTVPANAPSAILASRDVRDYELLELAVAGQATCIITGDPDLLDLHPFRGIPSSRPRNSSGRPWGRKRVASPEDAHCLRGLCSGMKVFGVGGEFTTMRVVTWCLADYARCLRRYGCHSRWCSRRCRRFSGWLASPRLPAAFFLELRQVADLVFVRLRQGAEPLAFLLVQ